MVLSLHNFRKDGKNIARMFGSNHVRKCPDYRWPSVCLRCRTGTPLTREAVYLRWRNSGEFGVKLR